MHCYLLQAMQSPENEVKKPIYCSTDIRHIVHFPIVISTDERYATISISQFIYVYGLLYPEKPQKPFWESC